MTDGWNQWSTGYVGGGEYPVYLTVHLACGAYVADGERHAKVCTAPPWEPTPVSNGETHDFMSDGSRT